MVGCQNTSRLFSRYFSSLTVNARWLPAVVGSRNKSSTTPCRLFVVTAPLFTLIIIEMAIQWHVQICAIFVLTFFTVIYTVTIRPKRRLSPMIHSEYGPSVCSLPCVLVYIYLFIYLENHWQNGHSIHYVVRKFGMYVRAYCSLFKLRLKLNELKSEHTNGAIPILIEGMRGWNYDQTQ